METTPEYQHEYVGDEAAAYESLRTGAKWQAEDAALVELLDAAAPSPARVLDIPVGTGRFLPHYVERHHTVTGADISEDMLSESRSLLATLGENDVTLEQADITHLTYEDASFDVTICIRLLNLVPADVVRPAVAELARVSSGHVIIGMRTYDLLSTPYQLVRKLKNRISGHTAKVNPQPLTLLHEVQKAAGLTLVRKVRIDTGARRSSHYDFYLYRTRS